MFSHWEEQVQTLEEAVLEASFPVDTGGCAEGRQAEKCLRNGEGADVRGTGCTRHRGRLSECHADLM